MDRSFSTAKEYIAYKKQLKAEEEKRSVRKRILIMSDTHGRSEYAERVLKKVGKLDHIIHCGDLSGDEDYIRSCAFHYCECPCTMVAGNNDFFGDLPQEETLMIAGQKIFVTHGHRYGVSYEYDRLIEAAKKKGADIVCTGHTHAPYIDRCGGDLLLINPGSLSLPRMSRDKSYAMLELDESGFRYAWINYLPEGRMR